VAFYGVFAASLVTWLCRRKTVVRDVAVVIGEEAGFLALGHLAALVVEVQLIIEQLLSGTPTFS